MEDYSERKSTYKRDFINKWYCSWDKKKSPIFLDEAIKSGEEISEELLVKLPSPRDDFETRILSKHKVEAFFETLDGKDKQILQMRMDGCTLEQIAARAKKTAIEAEKLTADNIYKVLIYFDKLYAVMDEFERRKFMESLVSEVHVYEKRKPNGQWLKSIKFKLPIIEEDMKFCLDNETHVETVALLIRK